ncbi:MAG: hypothetical protein Q4E34_00185 [Synergistaceae bacterium]|nr:hypothetical protein [Synergistaceae bacterium]
MQQYFGKSKGSILVETLSAAFIAAMFFPVILSLFKNTVDNCLRLYDTRTALQRICAAEAVMKQPVFFCGYGMPSDAAEYKKTFQNASSEPLSWEGPVSVASYNGRNNAQLKIAYAKREKCFTSAKTTFTGSGTVKFNQNLPSDKIKAAYSGEYAGIKNYVFFGGMSPKPVPLLISKISGNSLVLGTSSQGSFCIPSGEVLYLFCAMKLYAADGKLYSYDYRTSGSQPRVDGIEDVRFILKNGRTKQLAVYILARGNKERRERKIKLLDFEKDASNAELLKEWGRLECKKTLYASKTVWSLTNCVDTENFQPNTAD